MNNFKKTISKIKEKKSNLFFNKISSLLNVYWKKFSNGIFKVEVNNELSVKGINELIDKEFNFSSLEFPKSFTVNNLEDIAEYIVIPKAEKFPETIKIENLSDISKYIEIQKVEIPKDFNIKNLGDIPKTKFPPNVGKLSFKKSEELLGKLVRELVLMKKGLQSDEVFIKNKKVSEAIPVRIVDKRGYEFTEILKDGFFPAGMKIRNIAGDNINPATSEGQLTSNTLLTEIASNTADIELNVDTLEIIADPLVKYKFADLDDDASPNYYGAVDVEGHWYILKEDTTAKTLRYATGETDYTTGWTGRVSLSYQYLYNVTLY